MEQSIKNKHTFWTLCDKYEKIEVPIIQRDYAQGRDTLEAIRVRKKFINEFLITSLLNEDKIELDFVYGSTLEEKKEIIFIPLDGQQRLTTLFLLHFFIALKENRMNEVRDVLKRFTYETRPSTHDFCYKLIETFKANNIEDIKNEITDSEWYNEDWRNDPTVSGMLTMLDTFAKNKELVNTNKPLLDLLLDKKKQLVSFYFVSLEEFGLTENLYIRMNARGKMLTEFENFKSEFFKIINKNNTLLNEVKEKIEYDWVENLWSFKGKDIYVVDKPFMKYLSFITEMLYFKQAEFRSSEDYKSNFLDLTLLKEMYSNEHNLKFLIFALDFIKNIDSEHKTKNILWNENSTIKDILITVLTAKPDINELFILFSTISYFYQEDSLENYNDFIRVVRNLIKNTKDNSRREWPKLITSIEMMISKENIYTSLLKENFIDSLDGFYIPQREEEHFKAKLFKEYPDQKQLILRSENNKQFEGNITCILLSNYTNNENEFEKLKLIQLSNSDFNFKEFENTLNAYSEISINNFEEIRGNLITTNVYSQTNSSRLIYDKNHKKSPGIILFSKKYSKVKDKENLEEYLTSLDRNFIINLSKEHENFEKIRDVKTQLYLYYILNKQLYNNDTNRFFRNGLNFGWLSKEKGYKSLFSDGIENCTWFSEVNPIFQTYDAQFRYNLGLNKNNSLDVEILGIGNKKNPFKNIIEWSKG
jgi:hypothetical protein